MKLISIFYIIAVSFLPIVTFGSRPPPKIVVKVKFDRSFYNLEFSRDLFKYNEGARTYSVKIKDCNRPKVSQVENTYKSLLKEYSSQPPRQKTKYDLELSENGKKIEVARGSDLGTWLREMPKKIMYINAEAQASCKR